MAKFYEKFWAGDAEELGDFGLKWPKLSTLIPKEKEVVVLDFGCGNSRFDYVLFEICLCRMATGYDRIINSFLYLFFYICDTTT